MFRRKQIAKDLAVAKFYGVVGSSAAHESLIRLVAAAIAEVPHEAYHLQVNWGRRQKYSEAALDRAARLYSELEMFLVMADGATRGVAVTALFAQTPGLYEFCTFANATDASSLFARQAV